MPRASEAATAPPRPRAVVLAVLIVGLAAFASAELLLRLVLPAPTVFRALPPHLQRVSEVRYVEGVEAPARYEVNSLGVRGRECGAVRGDEYRVLCLGGSTTESLINDQSRTWTARVEEQLGTLPDGRRVWVGNAAKSGWSARHHVVQSRHLLDVHDPDAVTLLVGVNDLSSRLKQGDDYDPLFTEKAENQAALVRQSFAVSPGRFPDDWPDDAWYKRTRLWLLFRRLKYRALAMPEEGQDPEGRYLRRWRQARAGGRRTQDLPPLEAALDEYERNLREIVRGVRARGARILLLTQPVLWREGLTEEEKALLWMGGVGDFRTRPGSLYYEPEALARGMAAYNQRLLEVCQETGAECLDLAAVVPGTPLHFWDDCHFTDAGQAVVAQAVADALAAPFPRARSQGAASAAASGPRP